MLKAVIFDLDGTTVDIFETHLKAFQRVIEEQFNLNFTAEDLMKGYGLRGDQIMDMFFEEKDIKADTRKLALERSRIVEQTLGDDVKVLPGVRELLKELREKGIKTAVGTSSNTSTTELVLKAAGLWQYFDAIATFNDVENGKPNPDIFLKAAERLGAKPEDCVVLEDSPFGVQAARRAKMKVIAVTTGNHRREHLKKEKPNMIVDTLEVVNVHVLEGLF
ncbi:MAG: HAD family phosphatase [Candidatus Altiarchaeota archaeon]